MLTQYAEEIGVSPVTFRELVYLEEQGRLCGR